MDLREVAGCFFSQSTHSVPGNKEACFVPEIYLQSCGSDSLYLAHTAYYREILRTAGM
jgi:hypothetical protein